MNDRLRSELDYCVPLGIPHSAFLAWDEDDQDKAIAYTLEMRRVCKSCGTRADEWTNDKDAYTGDLYRCFGCERIEQEQDNVPDDKTKARGVKVRLIPRTFA